MTNSCLELKRKPLLAFPDTQIVGKRAIILVPRGYAISRMLLFQLRLHYSVTEFIALVFPGTPQEHQDVAYKELDFPEPTLVKELSSAAQMVRSFCLPIQENDLFVIPVGYALGGALWSLLVKSEDRVSVLFTFMNQDSLEGILPEHTSS